MGGRFSITVGSIMSAWPLQPSAGGSHRLGRVRLDTSNVSREMLHVNDPINTGIPSELEVEVEWFNLAERQNLPAAVEHPMALLCVDIHKGSGFPEEACFGK